MTKRSIKVTLEFTEENLNYLLECANFSDQPSLKVTDLTDEQFEALAGTLDNTPFMDEILDGSREACANDWLFDFQPEN